MALYVCEVHEPYPRYVHADTAEEALAIYRATMFATEWLTAREIPPRHPALEPAK